MLFRRLNGANGLALLLLTLALIGTGLWAVRDVAGNQEEAPLLPQVGKPLPAFSLPLLDDGRVDNGSLQGKPAFINFWATWCPPCRREMSAMQSIHEELGGKISVVAINEGEDPATIKRFMTTGGFTFRVALDTTQDLMASWGFRFLPTSVFVDSRGKVCSIREGEMKHEEMLRRVNEALSGC